MGGVLINGCGAKDYFTKMKYLGERTCPHCKQTTSFYLERAKMKVTVLFIPTVSIKERYAIMCGKCGQRNYIKEEEMHRIMAGQAVTSQNEIILDSHSEEFSSSVNAPDMAILSSEHPNQSNICPNCGAEVEGLFCGTCGNKITQVLASEISDSLQVCPNCGAEAEGSFCGNCGMRLV